MPRPTIEMSVGENRVKWWLHSHFAWSLVLLKNKQSFLFVYLLPTTAGKDEWIVLGAEMGWAEKLKQKGGDNFICNMNVNAKGDSSRGQGEGRSLE